MSLNEASQSAPLLSAAELSALLHFYRDSGVDWLVEDKAIDRMAEFAARPVSAPVAETRPARTAPKAAERPAPARTGPLPVLPDANAAALAEEGANGATTIAELEAVVAAFEACNLKASARTTAFLDGNREARLLVIGGSASKEDDREGQAFSGPAGALADRMLNAIGLDRTSVLLCNSVPWRVPGDQAPKPGERAICRAFVRRLVELAAPRAILMFGDGATRMLIDETRSLPDLRGQWFDLPVGDRTIPTLATYHPTDLIQAPRNKQLAWRDLLMFRAAIAEQPRD